MEQGWGWVCNVYTWKANVYFVLVNYYLATAGNRKPDCPYSFYTFVVFDLDRRCRWEDLFCGGGLYACNTLCSARFRLSAKRRGVLGGAVKIALRCTVPESSHIDPPDRVCFLCICWTMDPETVKWPPNVAVVADKCTELHGVQWHIIKTAPANAIANVPTHCASA